MLNYYTKSNGRLGFINKVEADRLKKLTVDDLNVNSKNIFSSSFNQQRKRSRVNNLLIDSITFFNLAPHPYSFPASVSTRNFFEHKEIDSFFNSEKSSTENPPLKNFFILTKNELMDYVNEFYLNSIAHYYKGLDEAVHIFEKDHPYYNKREPAGAPQHSIFDKYITDTSIGRHLSTKASFWAYFVFDLQGTSYFKDINSTQGISYVTEDYEYFEFARILKEFDFISNYVVFVDNEIY